MGGTERLPLASESSQAYSQHMIEWDQEGLLNKASTIQTVQQHRRYVDFERYSMKRAERKLNLPAIEG